MKFDNSLMIFGGLLLGLSSVAWMVTSPGDVAPDKSTAVQSQEVADSDSAEAAEATSDPTVTDLSELVVSGFEGRSGDFGEDRSPEVASDGALPVAHLGDPMLAVDAIDQDLEERHIGDQSIDLFSPD